MLTLIKDEFVDKPLTSLSPFGTLTDYNYVVVPRMNSRSGKKKNMI